MHVDFATVHRFLPPALLVLGLLSGCRDEPDEPAFVDYGPEPLYFEPIGMGQRAMLGDTMEVAIRDEAAWAAYRDSLRPMAPFKEVDFSQAMVLLAALPQQASGYSVEFTSVEQTDSTVVATYVVSEPGPDCLTSIAETVPFGAILVRRAEGPVRFVREREEYSCTFGRRG